MCVRAHCKIFFGCAECFAFDSMKRLEYVCVCVIFVIATTADSVATTAAAACC